MITNFSWPYVGYGPHRSKYGSSVVVRSGGCQPLTGRDDRHEENHRGNKMANLDPSHYMPYGGDYTGQDPDCRGPPYPGNRNATSLPGRPTCTTTCCCPS